MRDLWSRLRHDAYLAIVIFAGLLGLVSIFPFALYRWIAGEWVMVALDSLLTLTTLMALYIAWYRGQPRLAGQILSLLYAAGAIIAAIYLPATGLFWFYCVVLFNFFIAPPLRSTLITLGSLAAICLYGLWRPGTIFTDLQHLIIFACTALICSLFAYLFAWRTTLQRRSLQELANLDPLTGVGNRRTLMQEIEIALANFRRHGNQCGLLLLDIDHFKVINDTHGHAEGDRVLVDLADLVWHTSRRTDRLFRLGGEEFVLLLPGADLSGLNSAAQNIVRAVGERVHTPGGPVTVSIGGTLLLPEDDSSSWIHRADICLYQAKNGGRNRCVIHGAESQGAESGEIMAQ